MNTETPTASQNATATAPQDAPMIPPQDSSIAESSGSEDNSKKITFQPFIDKDYDCPLCQTHYKHRWQLRSHLHTEKKHYDDDHPYQEEIDDYLEQLEINPDLIPEGTICDYCQKELRNKYSRKRHQEHCRLNPISPNYRPLTPEWVKEYNYNLDHATKSGGFSEAPKASYSGAHSSSSSASTAGSASSSASTAGSSSSSASTYSTPTRFSRRSIPPIMDDPHVNEICRILASNQRLTIFQHPLFNITTGGPREVTIEPLYPIYISPIDGKLKFLFDLDSDSNSN